MAPLIPRTATAPRVIIYFQSVLKPGGSPQSLLPLLGPGIALSHIIVAAFHIHQDNPQAIYLNHHLPTAPLYDTLWSEAGILQQQGVKIMAMFGGAAPGCYDRQTLDAPDQATFLKYYEPVRDLLRRHHLDGIDLDVEQEMSLEGIVRLIRCLRVDFGADFIITLAPVAAAMLKGGNLSGFSYFDLESRCGADISWYNTQFYNDWGDISLLEAIYCLGWQPRKIVVGMLTNPENGHSFYSLDKLRLCIDRLRIAGITVGGAMGWEYFNSLPGGIDQPWLWAKEITSILRLQGTSDSESAATQGTAAVPHVVMTDAAAVPDDEI